MNFLEKLSRRTAPYFLTLACAAITMTNVWADNLPGESCQQACDKTGYYPKVKISLDEGSNTAGPQCACVAPGGHVEWNVKWAHPTGHNNIYTITFSSSPFTTAAVITQSDHNRNVKPRATERDYQYDCRINRGVTVDPHVVVGSHPPIEVAARH